MSSSPQLEIIDDGDELYRRIPPQHIKPNGEIASVAYMYNNYPDNEISVDVARLTDPRTCIARARKPGCQLGVLIARDPRALGFTVRHDPEENYWAHALMVGDNTKSKCKQLARLTSIVDAALVDGPPCASEP